MADLKAIADAVINGNRNCPKTALELTEEALAGGGDPKTIFEDGLMAGMGVVIEKFKKNEVFIPEVLISARAFGPAMEKIKPLLLAAGGFTALGMTGTAVAPTIVMVTCCLVGAYAFKGPFCALSASWLSASTLAAGLAGINAISNLIGGGLMVNVVGVVKEWTGSFVIGMIPLALLCAVAAVCVLVLGRSAVRATEMAAVKP